jgi:hypothetical protein
MRIAAYRKGERVNASFCPVLLAMILGTSPAPRAQFVPGDMIAKFAPGTDASMAVARATQVSPPDLGALAPAINCLQAKTGIPLKATQVTGGNWVVLSVDNDRLTDQVVTQLRTRNNVAKVEASPEKPEQHMGVLLPKKLVIKFLPGSEEAETVAKNLADATDVGFAQLISKLERDLDVPLEAEVIEETKVLVQIDLKALTPILVERLKALCDIESAQLNYIETIR